MSYLSRLNKIERRVGRQLGPTPEAAADEPLFIRAGRDYWPHQPWPKQQLFLDELRTNTEVFFGGAAGGGKSDVLLMAALEYVHVPGYAALILRRDLRRMDMPGAIMSRAKQWLRGTGALWSDQRKQFRFPSGATIAFGYVDSPRDVYRYMGSEFQLIGFDELNEFRLDDSDQNPYLLLFNRLRKTRDIDVPLRYPSTSNPGGIGHGWVKARFIDSEIEKDQAAGTTKDVYRREHPTGIRVFVPSKIRDNPAIDPEEYEHKLRHLPLVSRKRLMEGDWSIQEQGLLRENWLRYYTHADQVLTGQYVDADGKLADFRLERAELMRFVTCDTAGTDRDKVRERAGKTASWSVAGVWDYCKQLDLLFLRHVWRDRVGFNDLLAGIRKVYRDWQPRVVMIEDAPIAFGVIQTLAAELPIQKLSTKIPNMGQGQGGKVERAAPLLVRAENGKLFLPAGNQSWLPIYLNELTAWTGDPEEPNDQIDMSSYAARHVGNNANKKIVVFPQGR